MLNNMEPKTILVIGSGPIVIGRSSEQDSLRRQALSALKSLGHRIVLIDPNPTSSATDPTLADRTYLEPINLKTIVMIIRREKPQAIAPYLGGMAAINLCYFLDREGILKEYGIELLGLSAETIGLLEDHQALRSRIDAPEPALPDSAMVGDLEEGMEAGVKIGFPLMIRPALTLGARSIVYNRQDLETALHQALGLSPTGRVELEQSLVGCRALNFLVAADSKGESRTIFSTENVDQLPVNSGDAMVLSPIMTVEPKLVSQLADRAADLIRTVGIVGLGEVQFALDTAAGRTWLIEITPYLSRNAALAQRVTGLSLAAAAARLSVGLTLKEAGLSDIKPPQSGPVAFRVPRFSYENFPGADHLLTISMKSLGEVVGLADNPLEAMQKAFRSLEIRRSGLGWDGAEPQGDQVDESRIKQELLNPNDRRFFTLRQAVERGLTDKEINRASLVDPWYLKQIHKLADRAEQLRQYSGKDTLIGMDPDLLRSAKRDGFSDVQIGHLTRTDQQVVRRLRIRHDIRPGIKEIAGGGGSLRYLTYNADRQPAEDAPAKKKILIIGGGPNHIGQGAESQSCCVEAIRTLRELEVISVFVDSNPASVATDNDLADRVYLSPLTAEDLLEIIEAEKPDGLILQMGGQPPRKLMWSLQETGVPVLGTPVDAIDRAENRDRFKQLISKLGLRRPDGGNAENQQQAHELCRSVGYPVVARLAYALGGRAMSIVFSAGELDSFLDRALPAARDNPILIDKFLDYATELDVEALVDDRDVCIAGVLEHIEQAGVHSGDSACVLPPHTLPPRIIEKIQEQTKAIALELGCRGLLNVQFAVKEAEIFVLGITPRASLTVPLVSRATGVALAAAATRILLGQSLADQGLLTIGTPGRVAVKEAVFPFVRFPGIDPILGPEMQSTGQVMGISSTYGLAFMKSQQAAGQLLPTSGAVFFSLKDADKKTAIPLAKKFVDLGFSILATQGTADVFTRNAIPHTVILKVSEGRPNVIDKIINKEVHLLINTPSGRTPNADEISIRRKAYTYGVPLVTTHSGAQASIDGIEALLNEGPTVRSLQEYLAD